MGTPLFSNLVALGLGSNDIGLDRGQLGQTQLASFHVEGDKALLLAPVLGFAPAVTRPNATASTKPLPTAHCMALTWSRAPTTAIRY